jgi:hypothetical protein
MAPFFSLIQTRTFLELQGKSSIAVRTCDGEGNREKSDWFVSAERTTVLDCDECIFLPFGDSIGRLLPSVSGELLTDGFKREKDFFRNSLSVHVLEHLIAIPMAFQAGLT